VVLKLLKNKLFKENSRSFLHLDDDDDSCYILAEKY